MAATRAHVEAMAASAEPAYGVSTGFGGLATVHIPPEQRARLQRSLIASHAAGMGDPVEPEVVRAMVLLRARTLATGITGARPELAAALLRLLDDGRLPEVPEFGSLGCSGDLAPLAHVATALDLTLEAKEGLALINGTDGMLGMLVLACADLAGLLRVADVAAAMSVEGLLGTDRPFAADLVALRPASRAAGVGRQHRQPAGRLGHRRVAPHRRPPRPGRLLAAVRSPGARRRPRRPRLRRDVRRPRAGVRHRQPGGAGRRPGRVGGQLPRGAARPRLRPAGHRRRRRGRHERAPHRPLPRRHPQPRPAAVPGRTSRASTAA